MIIPISNISHELHKLTEQIFKLTDTKAHHDIVRNSHVTYKGLLYTVEDFDLYVALDENGRMLALHDKNAEARLLEQLRIDATAEAFSTYHRLTPLESQMLFFISGMLDGLRTIPNTTSMLPVLTPGQQILVALTMASARLPVIPMERNLAPNLVRDTLNRMLSPKISMRSSNTAFWEQVQRWPFPTSPSPLSQLTRYSKQHIRRPTAISRPQLANMGPIPFP